MSRIKYTKTISKRRVQSDGLRINLLIAATARKGGFNNYHGTHVDQCMSSSPTTSNSLRPLLSTMSQPCLPVTNVGPTHIMPHVYLGSQIDSLAEDILKEKGITHILNVSKSCPPSDSVPSQNFMRIPVMDSYRDQIIPFFEDAFVFLNNVKRSNGCVLIHCYAGISRSATLAIAYVMHELNYTMDEAYKYIKARRPTISPNFNFLGQLIEHERMIREARGERGFTITTDTTNQSLKTPPVACSVAIDDYVQGRNSSSLHRSTSALTPPARRPLTLARSASAVTPRPHDLPPVKSPPRPSFLKLSRSMDFNLCSADIIKKHKISDSSPIAESPLIVSTDSATPYISPGGVENTLSDQLTAPPPSPSYAPTSSYASTPSARTTSTQYPYSPTSLSCASPAVGSSTPLSTCTISNGKKRNMRPKCWSQAKKWCTNTKQRFLPPPSPTLTAQSPSSALANLRFDSCAVDSPSKTPARVAAASASSSRLVSPLRSFADNSTLRGVSFVGCQSSWSGGRPKSAIYAFDTAVPPQHSVDALHANSSVDDAAVTLPECNLASCTTDRIPRKARSYEDILFTSTAAPPMSAPMNYAASRQNSAHSSHSSIELIFCS